MSLLTIFTIAAFVSTKQYTYSVECTVCCTVLPCAGVLMLPRFWRHSSGNGTEPGRRRRHHRRKEHFPFDKMFQVNLVCTVSDVGCSLFYSYYYYLSGLTSCTLIALFIMYFFYQCSLLYSLLVYHCSSDMHYELSVVLMYGFTRPFSSIRF